MLAEITASFCAHWFRNEPLPASLLVIASGTSGNGKTHTLRAISRWANASAMAAFRNPLGRGWGKDRVPGVIMVSWPEVVTGLYEKDKPSLPLLDDMKRVEMLLVDDIGAENDPWKQGADALCQVLSKREHKFTAVTTNIAIANWATKWEPRIADRLLRFSDVVELLNTPSFATLTKSHAV